MAGKANKRDWRAYIGNYHLLPVAAAGSREEQRCSLEEGIEKNRVLGLYAAP